MFRGSVCDISERGPSLCNPIARRLLRTEAPNGEGREKSCARDVGQLAGELPRQLLKQELLTGEPGLVLSVLGAWGL